MTETRGVSRVVTFLMATVVVVLFRTPLALAADRFLIKGEIKPSHVVAKQYSQITQEDPTSFSVHVIIDQEERESTSINERGEFELRLDLTLSEAKILLRALHDRGLVSLSDYRVKTENLGPDGNQVIKNVTLIITSKENRFLKEVKAIQNARSSGSYSEAFGLLDDVFNHFLPSGRAFLYRAVREKIDTIHAALQKRYQVLDYELNFIYDLESHPGFDNLTDKDKYQIYLQFGRAIRSSPIKDWYTADGKNLHQIIEHSLSRAIMYQSRIGENDWLLHRELVSATFDSRDYERVLHHIDQFFELARYTDKLAELNERKAVVYFLIAYGDALSKLTNRLRFREKAYIDLMGQSFVHRQYWALYSTWLHKWGYLFGTGSSEESETLQTYFGLGGDIIKVPLDGKLEG